MAASPEIQPGSEIPCLLCCESQTLSLQAYFSLFSLDTSPVDITSLLLPRSVAA